MIYELVEIFIQTSQTVPEQVLFYRDGYYLTPDVVEFELDAIKKAFMRISGVLNLSTPAIPKITYVLVHKRHHTRFFPVRREDMDRSGNVVPGTLVDTSITHPSGTPKQINETNTFIEADFYLCSHPGLQGTSKPTYYHVLNNENNTSLPVHVLQTLTYRLCYLYCRATRSVSVCSPIYYAHLVAARARFHVHAVEMKSEDKKKDIVFHAVKKELARLMYFM
jgi:eukaryotic translation initiation factor 2C